MKYLSVHLMVGVVFIIATINKAYAQNISGRVTNETNNPISDVVIFWNSKIISKTDAKGIFTVAETFKLPLKIKFQHPDYYNKEFVLSKNNNVFKLSALKNTQALEEVIISSTYQKQSKVIIPTSKTTAIKFDEYSPVDLVSAINETPGVYIQSGALNTNRIVIRGVGSRTLYGTNKIRAYFNGIPITNGTGSTDIDAFNSEDISDIEIVKGPKATQYGTNLGGTLLLNSKQASAGETYIKNSSTVGSFGFIKNSISVATATDKSTLNLNYDHMEFDGFRDNSRYDRSTLLLNSNYTFNEKNEIGVLFNYTDNNAQIPSSISKSAFEEDPTQAAYTWGAAQGYEDNKQVLAGIHYTHLFSENFSNTTAVFYNYLDHYEPRPFNILDEFTNGYGMRTLFAKDFNFLEAKANLSFGGEFYRDQYNWKTKENLYENNNGNGSLEGSLLSDNIENRNNLNVFATITLPFTEKLKAQLGVNINKTNYDFIDVFNTGENNKDANRNFDPIFAPNLNILYQLTPNTNAYINVSRGFNYPSIEETLTPEGVINPELGPETGFNYEIGTEVYVFDRALHLQLSAYLLDINNLLVAERVGDDQYVGRNAGKTEHKGIELSLSYTHTFINGFKIAPYINAEITQNRFIDFVDRINDYSGNDLTGVPNNKVNGGISFGLKNFSLNTNILHIGDMPLNDANTLYSDAYTIFNTKLSYKNNITNHLTIGVNVGVNNFTNETYASSILINAVGFGSAEPRYYYPGIPRNWFSGLKIEYTL
ncbi:TonB-dependent receptor [Cellulophaga sp. HaHaR_3_176]|uniref:TonB-dependent receptor family protein n=1 Tax=Cellulophaga sp. HaHaR_3_176 TaxID=1942464 RepID=UPI001C200C98|nr:TonB-dependent receptor [Cellulophaga sp. HaHaR_3_176]QWX82647.1 TonB-dependent receptor [Cellulophaga sp. HaHaR_3_176]